MNLLPPETKKEIRREYLLRYIAFLSLFTVFSFAIGSVISVPKFVSLAVDYMTVGRELSNVKRFEPSEEDKKTLEEFQFFKDTLGVLDPKKIKTPARASEIIKLVTEEKPIKVALTGFSLIPEGETKIRLVLSGVARDRDSLVAFSKRIPAIRDFSNVNLPVSNLTKKENIEFSFVVTIGKDAPKTDTVTQ